MSRVLFISEKFIKENSQIDDNVDMKKILPTIWQSQTQYIQTLLGTLLYEDLTAKIEAGTLAGNDLILVNDYIADTLMYWCLYELQIPLLFNFRNKSTATNNSTFSQPIGTKELARIENRMKSKAEFFSGRLTSYLLANQTLFPKFLQVIDSDDLMSDSLNPSVSVYLGQPYRKCNKFLYSNEG
tara:strand:- start:144 stop:695 length:552 start_codon:yes stop_codon:yes gene_type:complete